MNIQVKIQGLKEAQKFFKTNAAILEGRQGQFYQKQSAIIIQAIEQHADSSYTNSPAKQMALESAKTWEHSGKRHFNKIYSTDYANYRQYCPDACHLPQAVILVELTDANQQELLNAAIEELAR